MIKEIYEGVNNNLKSKLFGLLREREKGREWRSFLDSIQMELLGYPEELKTINYYHLCWNINALRYLDYEYFRKMIFDTMTLLGKMNNDVL